MLEAIREHGGEVDEGDLRRALGLFDLVWAALHAAEQRRVVALLVEVTLGPGGIRSLAEEVEP